MGKTDGNQAPATRVEPMVNCACFTWARESIVPMWKHHKQCPHGTIEAESVALIKRLTDAMELWATDEDGIHPDAWEAYRDAKALLGVFVDR